MFQGGMLLLGLIAFGSCMGGIWSHVYRIAITVGEIRDQLEIIKANSHGE